MALINCKECGSEISDQAVTCPKCGCPIKNENVVNSNTIAPAMVNNEADKVDKLRGKNSTFSVLAVIFCFVGILMPVLNITGFVLAIIDLVKSKKDGRKKTLDIMAIVFSVLGVAFYVALFTVLQPKNKEESVDTSYQTEVVVEESTVEEDKPSDYVVYYGGIRFMIPGRYAKKDTSKYESDKSLILMTSAGKVVDDEWFKDFKEEFFIQKINGAVSSVMKITKSSSVKSHEFDGMLAFSKTYEGNDENIPYDLLCEAYIINNTANSDMVLVIFAADKNDLALIDEFHNCINNIKVDNGSNISTSTTTSNSSSATTSTTVGVSSDLKAFLDSYESFIDEYVIFMNKYTSNPANAASLMNEYSKILSKYQEFQNKLSRLDSKNMTKADYDYYIEVLNRCNKKVASLL